MKIDQNTSLNLVVGYPLTHTKSPLLHNAVYNALNLNAVLLARPHPNLSTLITAVKTLSVGLTAVTMPFKEAVLDYLDTASDEVTNLGAANTIIQHNEKLYGYNTDIDGIEYALQTVNLEHKNVLVLGAGGAARALGYVLKANKSNIYWLNRTIEKAEKLAEEFNGQAINEANTENFTYDVIVNTTPIGMHPNTNDSLLINYKFKATQIVFDLVYNPINTLLLRQAKAAGSKTISGVEMFIGQALKQIQLWQKLSEPLHKDSRIININLKNLLTGENNEL